MVSNPASRVLDEVIVLRDQVGLLRELALSIVEPDIVDNMHIL